MKMKLAASDGETVKLFDSAAVDDPCIISYTPSPGLQINCVKWNHTNLVVASAGDDNKISLWRVNGQNLETISMAGPGNVEECISSINFSNKGSRYICSGGSGQVVKIWDLQQKMCIKWLTGHTNTVTGVAYNCNDEQLASISVNGDLILHNLVSGAKANELKDPNKQVLRHVDYSRNSGHLFVTAGDDGSVHLWDSTSRSPKVSWLKQHSAPTSGLSFSPLNDKIIASVGLDKKLYTYDTRCKRRSFCCSYYNTPYTSLAIKDDGLTLAAGTSSGQVILYDFRGKPQPLNVLQAYGNSKGVTSLCWERSKPINIKNEASFVVGGASKDSITMTSSGLSTLTSSSSSSETSHKLKDSMENFSPVDEERVITSSEAWGGQSDPRVTETSNHVPSILAAKSKRNRADSSSEAITINAGQTNSFSLQLYQRSLEGTLASIQESIHQDMRNLHIEVLRQFHTHEMETSSKMKVVLEKQAALMKDVQSLRKEMHHLSQLL